MSKLLQIKNLIVGFRQPSGELTAVKGVSLELEAGETLALVGESGCGKTVLCKSMLRILCERGGIRQGEILLEDRELTALTDQEMAALRGGEIAMVFQDPYTALDPAFSVGSQIAEVLQLHQGISAKEARSRAVEMMELVQIPQAEKRYHQRPYQFSGGMRQRIVIAIALAGNPKLLLADEPTTALDEETQKEVLELLKQIQQKIGIGILFITHDLGLVEDMASRVAVMKGGEIVEQGAVADVFRHPQHPYTKKLLGYLDYKKDRGHNHRHEGNRQKLQERLTAGGIAQAPDCGNCGNDKHQAGIARDPLVGIRENHQEQQQTPVLSIRNLCKSYPARQSIWSGAKKIEVLKDFSMEIYEGEIVGLIGPSGCGKSTLSRCITGLETPDGGEIELQEGLQMQMIFQDSQSAFNERMTVAQIIAEPLRIRNGWGFGKDSAARGVKSHTSERKSVRPETLQRKVMALMEAVELDPVLLERKPYQLSGGQRQRVAIARALITEPDFILADEPLTGLDVSAQAQIVHLLKRLAQERNLTILFIAHDLPMVNHISDRVIRM